MARARPKASPIDHHARRAADALGSGRPVSLTPDFERYLDSAPHDLMAAFTGAARHMPPAGKDEALAFGYLFVLQGMLERLRFRTDAGYADAAQLIADFQADVAAQAEFGTIGPHMLAYASGALHQAKISAAPALAAAMAEQHVNDDEGGPLPPDVRVALAGLLDACSGDPFEIVGVLADFGHALPAEARGVLAAGLAFAGTADARSAAVLFLLDPLPVVRRAVVDALASVAAVLSPSDVRRLIAIRNWRPEQERAQVDAVIRKARAAGIACAQWDAGGAETILATTIDGVAAQGFVLVSAAGRKKRMSSILAKNGIVDAFSSEAESARQIEASLSAAGTDAPMLHVSRAYLDRMMAHHVALGIQKGETPPPGLLQVAETIGGADWQPAGLDFRATLAALIADLPAMLRGPQFMVLVLRRSGDHPDIKAISQSWFEDGPELASLVTGARGISRKKAAAYLLQTVLPRRRQAWADVFVRAALWLREAGDAGQSWSHLAIVAQALVDGRDMSEIGLMCAIARRTVAVLSEQGRSQAH